MFVPSDHRLRNGGWLHRLTEAAPRSAPPAWRPQDDDGRKPSVDMLALARRYHAALNGHIEAVAAQLGVSADALRALRAGWDGEAVTFPMRDADGLIVGIRRRFPDGRKLAVRGGREGLFVPMPMPASRVVFVVEGPTDTAALLTLGLAGIGRPSNVGGHDLLVSLFRRHHPRRVVILRDGDAPGSAAELATRRGAERLAVALREYDIDAVIRRPPLGVKDMREWLRCQKELSILRELAS